MRHIKDIIDYYLEDDPIDFEDFIEWAAGKGWRAIAPSNLWKAWNDLHSDLLELSTEGNPYDDIPKMIDLWKKNNNTTLLS